jgi:signal transduction histidine kinase
MNNAPTLEAFAQEVVTASAEQWIQTFVTAVKQRLSERSEAALFLQQVGALGSLASTGETPSLSPDVLHELPYAEQDTVMLPVPCVPEALLWLRTSLSLEEAQERLGGWLAVAGIGLARHQQEQAAKRHEASRNHFFSMVNHELKSPLSSIKAMSDLIVRKIDRGTLDPATEEGRADLTERLGFLSMRVREMASLIDEISDVAAIERARLVLNPQQSDLSSIVRVSIDNIAEDAGRAVAYEDPDEPLLVNVDARRFVKVFSILLKNACDYSMPDSPIHVRVRQEGSHALVEVEDHGRGIEEERLERLFHEYGRSVQGPGGGLGIGLYLAGKLVAAHRGTVQLESKNGAGTTASVRLPLVSDECGERQNEEEESGSDSPSSSVRERAPGRLLQKQWGG